MAITNRDRVNSALELLYQGLLPYVVREMKAEYKAQWVSEAEHVLNTALQLNSDGEPHIDTGNLLRLMFNAWNQVFGTKLGHTERSIVSELREARNRAYHQESFSGDDTERTLDNVYRLLTAISAPQAQEVRKQYDELRRLRFEEQARSQRRRQPAAPTEGQPAGNLKPWRDIVTPHPDVAGGRYQQAEFAADLGQVHRGEGVAEYSNPREFFQRTYLTEGLKRVLVDAVKRLDDSGGGNPVVKLQTNFGGGKTHTMLALYHLFSEIDPSDLPGVDEVLVEAGVDSPAHANRAVLVGTARGPAQPETKPDGTVVNTLWGDMAWQLLGKDGYDLVAESDHSGSSPGSDRLRELFILAEPSLILIDEWVAYVRQLYGVNGLPGGSFDANLSFAQALTEAARAVPGTLIIASLPQSDIETGGEAGQQARASLENTFARIESVWKPASADESFEIVRRRLFQGIRGNGHVDRDVVIRGFIDHYRNNPQEFPTPCREGDYERRMRAAYPIHPELFDRLYNDWSTLERFQRTRGVLRLMASVIHTLWERDDHSLLIMPSTVPIDDPAVQYELTRYLEDAWQPIIERDVDGPNSLPLAQDRDNPNLGRYSATRRVARSIYMGSAPIAQAANRGIDDRSINLACVQPGESVATFGDALRRLTDAATFLYVDGRRYWYSTQPSVNRLAQDRAGLEDDDTVEQEIIRRLRDAARTRGDFARVHVAPESTDDVPEDRDARLVILGPDRPHASRDEHKAEEYARQILSSRGNSPRQFQNTLVFLAADRARLGELETSVRQYLAWKSIDDEREALNLDAFQSSQARTRRTEADRTVDQRIPQAYCWLLYPDQPDPNDDEITWTATRLQGDDPLAERASRKLINDGQLASTLGPAILQMRLDRIPLWRGDHVSVSELRDFYAQYLYLERLKSTDVLLASIQEGVASVPEYFAYADRYDGDADRYERLAVNHAVGISADGSSVLIKSDVARAQLERESEPAGTKGTGGLGQVSNGETTTCDPVVGEDGTEGIVDSAPIYRRFYGSIDIPDLVRFGREAGRINEEILTHLANVPGAKVKVTIEIEAEFPEGIEDRPRDIVQENARALTFNDAEFERE